MWSCSAVQMNGMCCRGIAYCSICVDKKFKYITEYGSNEWAILGARKCKNDLVLSDFNTAQMSEQY